MKSKINLIGKDRKQQSEFPPDGSFRDCINESVYKIQMYKWGTWNTIVTCPIQPDLVEQLAEFVMTTPTLANTPLAVSDDASETWPFSYCQEKDDDILIAVVEEEVQTPQENKTSSSSYIDYIRKTLQDKEHEAAEQAYNRAKQVIDQQR